MLKLFFKHGLRINERYWPYGHYEAEPDDETDWKYLERRIREQNPWERIGKTHPLSWAIFKARMEVARVLLENGARLENMPDAVKWAKSEEMKELLRSFISETSR
ncbi:hypothetical protein BJY01DRAFT_219427 [Aspergillus pseudoustus]|uniref:Ankyrin repeat-containing domain protein n=1 Tax=Aspergillus pseudoustus TaxID=1810923 RepID=A0ABR4JGD5_9EURO